MILAKYFDKYIKIIVPAIFIILTFFISISRTPFYDETHAFIISGFNLKEIFYLTRIEGHPILWYLILKPFSNFNLYPYSMLIINWLFASCLIIFFWRFCPFNNFLKTLITFSYPFFHYAGIVARPYTISILILFLLAFLYKKAFKHPLIYLSLMIINANLTLISCIATSGFLSLFLYDFFTKEKSNLPKKTVKFIYLLMFLGIFLLIIQFCFYETTEILSDEASKLFIIYLSRFLYDPLMLEYKKNLIQVLFNIISLVLIYYTPYLLFKKDKRAFANILISTFALIFFFYFIYIGSYWHYFFFIFCLISVFWVAWDKIKTDKVLNIILTIFFILNLSGYSIASDGKIEALDTKNDKKIVEILKQDKYKNAKLFTMDAYSKLSCGMLIYLKRENIAIYDTKGYDKTSFNVVRNLQKRHTMNVDEFYDLIKENKKNYLITAYNYDFPLSDFSVDEKDKKINFILKEQYKDIPLAIFEISKN